MKRILIPAMVAAALAPAAAFSQATVTQGTEISPNTVQRVQVELAARGFSPGPADGLLNPQTVNAIQQLQRTHDIATTGQLDVRTLSALGIAHPIESSGTPPPGMIGPGSTAPSGRPEGPTPTSTPLPGTVAQGVPLGATTPAGAPAPSFGATPAGAPSPSFGSTQTTVQPMISPAPSIASPTTPATPGGSVTTTTTGAAAARSSGR